MPRLTKARKELLTAMMKDAIFTAAVTVLNEHGPNGVTMDRVAKAANVARSSLYDYLRDRDELFRFVVSRITEPIQQAIAAIVQSDALAAEKLASIYRAVLTTIGKQQGLLILLTHASDVGDAIAAYKTSVRTSDTIVGLLAKIFEQGINEGRFRRTDPLALARMFIASGGALVDMQSDAGALGDAKQIERQIEMQMSLFLHGLSTGAGTMEAGK